MSSEVSNQELMQKISKSLVNIFGVDPAQITPETRMRDLGVDSMHVVEILFDLETELGVTLTDFGFPPNPTLEEVAQTISKNIAERSGKA